MTRVVLSLGSNINREANIRAALDGIGGLYGELDVSPVYETEAVGFDGPAFFNLVVGFETAEPLLTVRERLRGIESAAGRVRGGPAFASRVLDIDVILFGEHDLRPDGFNIPRDEIEKYAFVLKPLSDLYPDRVHPVLGASYAEMWRSFTGRNRGLRPARLTG